MCHLQMSAILTVYHYTNKEGRDAIKKSGKILQSSDLGKDAAFGEGSNNFLIKRNIHWFMPLRTPP